VSTEAELKEELERIKAENEALKARSGNALAGAHGGRQDRVRSRTVASVRTVIGS
jgi:hypothetical protein